MPFTLLQSLVDDQGRYIFLLCKVAGVSCIIANVYIPPPFTPDCLNILAQFMAQHSNVPLWVMEDFNNVLDRKLDRFSSHSRGDTGPSGPTPFAKRIGELGLKDVWRKKNPGVQSYSCYSASYCCLSRIDMSLSNMAALGRTDTAVYVPRNITDHSPLILGVDFTLQRQNRLWKVNPF